MARSIIDRGRDAHWQPSTSIALTGARYSFILNSVAGYRRLRRARHAQRLCLQVLEGIAMPTRFRRTAPAALVAALVALTPWLAASATNTEPPQILVQAYNASGVDIFQRLASSPGNIAFSPLSIGTAMDNLSVLTGTATPTDCWRY